MRARTFVATSIAFLALACGGPSQPAPAPITPAPIASASTPPPAEPAAPALPPEPANLAVAIVRPQKVCELSTLLNDYLGLDLAPSDRLQPFAHVGEGVATVSYGDGGVAFAEVIGGSFKMRGFVTQSTAAVYPKKWLSFGGVFYPGSSTRLSVTSAHDGKLVVAAPDTPGFTLADGGKTLDVQCDDVALRADADGALATSPPPAFASPKPAQKMLLKRNKPTPLSADVNGAPGGTIDASDAGPLKVSLLEKNGKRARIRWGHLAGWVDAALLSTPPKPSTARQSALEEAAEFGMIGFVDTTERATSGPPRAPDAQALVCTSDVRVVAVQRTDGARAVTGTLTANKPFRVLASEPELTALAVDDLAVVPLQGARIVVPSRDIAGCTKTEVAAVAQKKLDAKPPEQKPDAIDALDGNIGGLVAIKGDAFGPGGLGLSGVGIGGGGHSDGGIGLGSIGSGGGSRSASLRQGATQVNGRLPPEVIQRIVRMNFGRFRLCYENGLRANPALRGRVAIKFVIDEKGAVKSAQDGGSDMPDAGVVRCVARSFANMSFPQPEGGVVTVVYPIIFDPPDAPNDHINQGNK